jgi:hypothetical protein
MEKKQAVKAEKGVAVLMKAHAKGLVDSDVTSEVGSMLSALHNHDYGSASSIVTTLASHE